MRYAVSISSMMFLSLLGGVAQARGPAGGARGERPASDRPAAQRPASERTLNKPEWLRARAERVGAPAAQRVERSSVAAREITKESSSREASAPRVVGTFKRVSRIASDAPVHKSGSRAGGTEQQGGAEQGGAHQGGSHQGGAGRPGGAGSGGDDLRLILREKQRCPAGDVLCGAQRGEIPEPGAPDPKTSGKATLDLAKEAPADGGLLKLVAPLHKVAQTFRTETVRKLLCNKADAGFCSR